MAALLISIVAAAPAPDRPSVVVVVGAAGEAEYGEQFAEWAERWKAAAEQAGAAFTAVGLDNERNDRERLRTVLRAEVCVSPHALWLVLIGHGTFDGRTARFNLRGPDLSAADLAGWLEPARRPLAVINCASASGPFLPKLSAAGRVVIVAAKSGYEQNFARFGDRLATAITDPTADLDKDGQTSLLEAYLIASRRVSEFYKSESRLATEHALLDDNGDGLGTPADWFRGIRAVRKAEDGATHDGYRAHQFHLLRSEREQRLPAAVRAKRDTIELAIAALREKKADLTDDAYYAQLEPLVLDLARLYARFDKPDE